LKESSESECSSSVDHDDNKFGNHECSNNTADDPVPFSQSPNSYSKESSDEETDEFSEDDLKRKANGDCDQMGRIGVVRYKVHITDVTAQCLVDGVQ